MTGSYALSSHEMVALNSDTEPDYLLFEINETPSLRSLRVVREIRTLESHIRVQLLREHISDPSRVYWPYS